jgi:hypothetical protein
MSVSISVRDETHEDNRTGFHDVKPFCRPLQGLAVDIVPLTRG